MASMCKWRGTPLCPMADNPAMINTFPSYLQGHGGIDTEAKGMNFCSKCPIAADSFWVEGLRPTA